MNAETPENAPKTASYHKVTDSRGHRVRGLWERNGRFVAQLRVPGKKHASKVPLLDSEGNPVLSVPQAKIAMEQLLRMRRENGLPILKRTPTLTEWIDGYILFIAKTGKKDPKTVAKEKGTLARWAERLGTIRLSNLRRSHVNDFIVWRKEAHEVCNRTINLDLIALNNCLNHAIDEGRLIKLPTENWKPLEHVSPCRPLWTDAQIEAVCAAALKEGENGPLLVDYVKFMAFSGTRRNEALHMRWEDVNFERKTIVVLKTKYGHQRTVDFNTRLEEHLIAMTTRRAPGSEWLFPSPRSHGDHVENLQGSLETARAEAGLPNFQFHDLRHYFISSCVMAGIDYMTIARWVGHKDGGILIGKVYGKLNDGHARKQAQKLFAVAPPVEAPQAVPSNPADVLNLLQQLQAQIHSMQAGKAA